MLTTTSGRLARLLSLSAAVTAATLLSAGPALADAGRYTVTVSSGASFRLLNGNNLLTAPTDDAVIVLSTTNAGPRKLPFPLRLYLAKASTVSVSTNGNVQFTATGTTAYANTCLPTQTFASTAVAMPFWDDLAFDPTLTTQGFTEGVFTRTAGVKPHRTFTISWQGHRFSVSDVVLAQAVFTEGSPNVTYVYGTTGGTSATVGTQAKGAIQRTQWTCDGTGTASGVSSGQKLAFVHHR